MTLQLFLKDARYDKEPVSIFEQAVETDQHEIYLQQQVQPNKPKSQLRELTVICQPLKQIYESYELLTDAMNEYQGLCHYCNQGCEERAWPQVCPADSMYKLKSVCCSFPCLLALINEKYKYNKQKRERYLTLAKQVFVMRYNQQPKSLEASPKKTLQTQYGGTLSQRQYRDCIKTIIDKSLPRSLV